MRLSKIKKYSFFIIFVFITKCFIAQNLVVNGDFETLNYCPTAFSQVIACANWYPAPNNILPPNATDYLNACNNSGTAGVPNNPWGYQVAHSGVGYMALATMASYIATDYRENIYTQLAAPLIIGNTYSVSMYVSHTDDNQYSTNNLGFKFSKSPGFPINNIAHVVSSAVITDNINWTLISGTFIADSAYIYVAVGNFFTDANTTSTVSCASCPYRAPGYFIDDVSVIPTPTPTCTTTINGSNTVCRGQEITLTAQGGTSYAWSTGENTNSITVNPISTSSYTVISTLGTCTSQAVTTVSVVSSGPIVSINGAATICPGQNTKLSASGASTYTWNMGANSASVTLNPIITTTYIVTGGTGTCTSQAVAVVIVDEVFDFILPDIITPNNDGINEFIDFSKYRFSSMQLDIYNRWGKKIFESDDTLCVWKPGNIDDGTYFYVLQYFIACNGETHGKTLRGFLTSLK